MKAGSATSKSDPSSSSSVSGTSAQRQRPSSRRPEICESACSTMYAQQQYDQDNLRGGLGMPLGQTWFYICLALAGFIWVTVTVNVPWTCRDLERLCIYGLNYAAQWSGSTCKLGPQAISFLCKGSCSAALLLRVGPGALQILLQRCRPLALRLRGVPRAVQLLLQALCPLASCSHTKGASGIYRSSLR